MQANEMMSPSLITIGADEPIYRAYDLMKRKSIRHLPVCDKSGEIIGVLSDRDVQRAMMSRGVEDDSGLVIQETSFAPGIAAGDHMSQPVRVFDAKVDLRKVAHCFREDKISCVLLTRDSKIVGLLTSDDLIKYLLSLLEDSADETFTEAGTILDRTYLA